MKKKLLEIRFDLNIIVSKQKEFIYIGLKDILHTIIKNIQN